MLFGYVYLQYPNIVKFARHPMIYSLFQVCHNIYCPVRLQRVCFSFFLIFVRVSFIKRRFIEKNFL